MVAIVSHKREAIHFAVQEMYTAVATTPARGFHFPTGRAACRVLGYPDQVIAGLPESAVESFAGVGYPFGAGAIRPGDHVLDIGSGSGTDTFLAARLVGPAGKVYGLDMTPAMRDKLQQAAAAAKLDNVEVLAGDVEAIPLPDQSVDVVTSNGVLNLVPDKPRAIAEIYRVLKPGGRLQLADIALARPVAARFQQDPQLWAECVVGAVDEDRYLQMLRAAGFERIEAIAHLDYFSLSSSAKTREVAGLFDAHSIVLRAAKPAAERSARAVTSPARRAAKPLVQQLTGIAGAVVAWLVCAGAPPLIAGFTAVGAGALARHAYMLPVFAACVAASVWLLWRSGRVRRHMGPFWVGLASAVFALATFWLSLVKIFPSIWWWPYVGIAGLVGAAVWSFVAARRATDCLDEMIREAELRAGRGSPAHRIAFGTFAGAVAMAVLYGLYASVDAFLPDETPTAVETSSRSGTR